MYPYSIVDTSDHSRLVALRDAAGRYHIAHCTSDMPSVNTMLLGDLPTIGFALLQSANGEVYRLVFSLVNCGQMAALGALHPKSLTL